MGKKKQATYKPNFKDQQPQKRQKTDTAEFKTELKVTPKMFEAARMMKGGVSNVKDLDMSVLKPVSRQTVKREPGSCTVTLVNIESGEVTTLQKQVRRETIAFDFNAKDKFNTNTDTTKIGKECWDYLLNPLGVDYFTKNIQNKQLMIITNREGFTYDQQDPEDDLISLDITKQVLKQSSEMYKESDEQALQYGRDVKVWKVINGTRFEMHNSKTVQQELAIDQLLSYKCKLQMLNPQEFSTSIAKLLCFGDEIFECDHQAQAQFTPYNDQDQTSVDQYSEQCDQFILQMEGRQQWQFNSDVKLYQGTISKNDLIYIPAGIKAKSQTNSQNPQSETFSLHVTIKNQIQSTYEQLITVGFNKQLKSQTILPVNMFSQSQSVVEHYKNMVRIVCDKMCDETEINKVIKQWQKRFMQRRQAPQELLETNEVDDVQEADQWNSASEVSEPADQSEESQDDKPDFSEVKLTSKHAAYLKQSKDSNYYLHYCTQNQRKFMAVAPQKLRVEPSHLELIKKIIASYPSYVKCPDSMLEWVDVLADLQVVIVR